MIKFEKGIFILPLIFFAFSSLNCAKAEATGDSISLIWRSPIVIHDNAGTKRTVLYFDESVHGVSLIPQKIIRFKGKVTTLILQNVVAEDVPSVERIHIPASYVNQDFSWTIQYGYEKNQLYSLVSISSIRVNPTSGSAERLRSFSVNPVFGSTDQALPPAINNNTGSSLRIASPQEFSTTSVLSSGQWYKLSINSSGMHKIDYQTLKDFGINPDILDPRKIRLFGNGGGMLPQNNSAFRYDDLVENSIRVIGEEDGKFDEEDYILFYAKGPHTWQLNENTDRFKHSYNIYTESAFYFLTIGSSYGLRVSGRASLGAAEQTITSFNDYAFYEEDKVNLLRSGRDWFGDKFDYNQLSGTYSFRASSIVPNSPIFITASVMAVSTVSTSFSVHLNNLHLGSVTLAGIGNLNTNPYSLKGTKNVLTFSTLSNSVHSSGLNVKLDYNQANVSSSIGYLDYLEINFERKLGLYGNQTHFRSLASINASTTEYLFPVVSPSATIWDITDPLTPEFQEYNSSGSGISFIAPSGTLREYIVFYGSDFPKPTFAGLIKNQNLHSIGSPVPELLIVTADQFYQQAERLAAHRKQNDGITSRVVRVSEIFNEFGSGAPDVTAIRDFVKMVYDRGGIYGDSLRYLLLFGDCSYDYKYTVSDKENFIPVYESRESLHPLETYSSDDYFGFLSINIGDWEEDAIDKSFIHFLDIGIGRLPVSTSAQADIVVSKLINYDVDPEGRKKWRNRLVFVADDGDSNIHQTQAERLCEKVFEIAPVFNINKIYLDAYPQIAAPGGEVAAEAKQLLNLTIEKGVLIMNFTGHGGITGLTQERVLETSDILSWNNTENLPFMVTATCEFGRYDDPEIVSAAEHAVLRADAGAIGLITTTRPVNSGSNFKINNALYDYIFLKNNGNWQPLGDIMRQSKNSSINGVYNRNFSLLGDPSQTLAYPDKEIIITAVKGKDPSETMDTLKALGKVTISGEVRESGSLLSNFNGVIDATVFDKPSLVHTLGNEANSPGMNFNLYNNYVYDGKASVKNGKFNFSFIVPKDISYQVGNGKISLYGNSERHKDGHGYESRLIVGGSADNVVPDNVPPQIKLYMNDESFVNGGVIGKNANLIIKLFDENGINIAGSGIGHEITATIDNSNNIIVLNDYYSATLDNYQEGTIEFPVKDLEPGIHTIRVKAWDTHNNSNESYLEFVVLNDEQLGLRNILNYPNPFSTSTNFHFDHNRVGDDLEVMVQVYTVSGKLVTTLMETIYKAKSHISEIHWNGRDDFGDRIGKGVYVYKLEVRSIRDGSKNHKFQKLVILN